MRELFWLAMLVISLGGISIAVRTLISMISLAFPSWSLSSAFAYR